jgi:hypothetical protein
MLAEVSDKLELDPPWQAAFLIAAVVLALAGSLSPKLSLVVGVPALMVSGLFVLASSTDDTAFLNAVAAEGATSTYVRNYVVLPALPGIGWMLGFAIGICRLEARPPALSAAVSARSA